MSWINGVDVSLWIRKNKPENGLFRAYWAEDGEGISLEDTGFGLRYEWEYKDGKRVDGISKSWYENGQLSKEVVWKKGKRHGVYTHWHDNGQKWKEVTFKDGFSYGLQTWWYENGQKKSEGIFLGQTTENRPDGKWTYWYENGKKQKEIFYESGIYRSINDQFTRIDGE